MVSIASVKNAAIRSDIMINKLRNYTTEAGMWELLTEELCELAQETSKYARLLRNEIPSNSTLGKVYAHIREELSDVVNCLSILDVRPDFKIAEYKLQRMIDRYEKR